MREQKLDNYMNLIRAINIAGSLRILEDDIKDYEEEVSNYLHEMKNL